MPATLRALAAGLLLVLLAAGPLRAQAATVHGRVLDDGRHPVVGATVTVEGTTLGVRTDARGVYSIAGVAPGARALTAHAAGFRAARTLVTLAAGGVQRVDFTLGADPLGLDELVVSGAFNPATKLESSTAITTLTPDVVNTRVARGTADLLRAVPGVQVTSNYGESGADVTVRGLPQTANSSFRYVSLQEDGLPAFEAPGLAFAFPDAMVRVDQTVARVEVVRGGTAAVLASSTPGGIVNFISKTGGTQLDGLVRSTLGAQGLFRQDLSLGGPLLEQWRFHLGGYYRHDRGVRYPGFPANRGGQLKANLTRDLPGGYLRLYAKYLNERNVWYMGIPLQNYLRPQAIAGGPDVGTGTTFAAERLQLRVPDALDPGGSISHALSDGYHVRYRMVGAELSRDLGEGWNLTLRSRVLRADNDMNLMADVADPFPISTYGAPGIPAGVPRLVRFVNTGEILSDPDRVAGLNGNGLMSVHGLAFVDQPVGNFISNAQLTRQLGTHSLSGGVYLSGYGTELRLTQHGLFLEVANHPRTIQILVPGPTGAPVAVTPADGFSGFNTALQNARNFTTVAAVYLGDEWQPTGRLQVDVGLRLDHSASSGAAERPVNPGRVVDGVVTGQAAPPGFPAFTPTAQQSARGLFGSGRFRTWDYRFTTLGGSLGANLRLWERVAVYGRASRGTRIPTVQQWTFQPTGGDPYAGGTVRGEVESIVQGELGLKTAAERWSALVTGFYGRSSDLITVLQRGQLNGSFAFLPVTGDTRTIGVELEGVARPLDGLQLRAVATLQDPRFTRFRYQFFVPGSNPLSGPQHRDYSGNRLNDAVGVMGDFTTTYSRGGWDVFGNLRHTGSRMANRPNTLRIPPYSELAGGLGRSFRRVRVDVQGANLLNTRAVAQLAARTGEDVLRVHPDGTAESLVTTGPAAGTTTRTLYTTGMGIPARTILISAGYGF